MRPRENPYHARLRRVCATLEQLQAEVERLLQLPPDAAPGRDTFDDCGGMDWWEEIRQDMQALARMAALAGGIASGHLPSVDAFRRRAATAPN